MIKIPELFFKRQGLNDYGLHHFVIKTKAVFSSEGGAGDRARDRFEMLCAASEDRKGATTKGCSGLSKLEEAGKHLIQTSDLQNGENILVITYIIPDLVIFPRKANILDTPRL